MTFEGAFEIVSKSIKTFSVPEEVNDLSLFLRFYEALEKQIPQKPYYLQYDGNPNIGNYHCPACRLIIDLVPIDHNKKTFCLHCGQAIDWSDEE